MIFCTLVLEDGTEVGKKCILFFPPLGYTLTHEGVEYTIKKGRLKDPAPDEPIKRYAIDETVLTVEEVA